MGFLLKHKTASRCQVQGSPSPRRLPAVSSCSFRAAFRNAGGAWKQQHGGRPQHCQNVGEAVVARLVHGRGKERPHDLVGRVGSESLCRNWVAAGSFVHTSSLPWHFSCVRKRQTACNAAPTGPFLSKLRGHLSRRRAPSNRRRGDRNGSVSGRFSGSCRHATRNRARNGHRREWPHRAHHPREVCPSPALRPRITAAHAMRAAATKDSS
jgi:hypothetical protein